MQSQHHVPEGRFAPSRRPVRILCLSGGGYRGLFAARVLAQIERRLLDDKSIEGMFDLLAGTSVGGLMAGGLAVGKSARHLQDALIDSAPRLFPRLRWRSLRKAMPAPYDPRDLADAVVACIGPLAAGARLDSIDRPLLIPTMSWVRGELRLLRSRGLAPALADSVTLMDAALATTAAPGHFPPHLLSGDPHLDGGLCANAPDALAIAEAIRHLGAAPENIRVLSIGTVGTSSGGMPGNIPRWGFRWPLAALLLSISAQERLVIRQCEAQLGARYLRINQVPGLDQKPLGDLDVVDASMTGALIAYADAAVEDLLGRRGAELDEFLR